MSSLESTEMEGTADGTREIVVAGGRGMNAAEPTAGMTVATEETEVVGDSLVLILGTVLLGGTGANELLIL